MKVLVIGNGAREHAIVWKLKQSPKVDKIYCAPGNAGIVGLAECIDISVDKVQELKSFALHNKIDLTVVGPELPLTLGIVDVFEENGLRIFGPNKKAAQLEGSKAYAKDFMHKYQIPTAKYKVYTELQKAVEELQYFALPVVIKADGLAAGKGVIVAQNRQEAVDAIYGMMGNSKFGKAGSRIVIEEYLVGKEVSMLAFMDGKTTIPMTSAQDYKRALDGDDGLNTGGMGAISPSLYYSADVEAVVKREILVRTVDALKAEGIKYKGVLYFGLMLTNNGPKVLEFNVRFGDPETQVILPRLQSDLLEVFDCIIDEKLEQMKIEWTDQKAVCVVMASGGYPEEYDTGYEIHGLNKTSSDICAFHAGTKAEQDRIETAGGRVLTISSLGSSYQEAHNRAYEAISKISFHNMHFRKDIGKF